MTAPFSFGIEEEYFLVDAQTKAITRGAPDEFFTEVIAVAGDRVAREFLRSQIEVITPPHVDMAAARAELRELREIVASTAARYGMGIMASGTHPTGTWRNQKQTEGERYDAVMDDLQMIGQRDLLCGLHVHVELDDPEKRIDVMYRVLPYLPLFIALSNSSPFWQSRRTGLMGYRLAAYDELPRTGIPELFRTLEEYDAYVDALVRAGVMPDASYVWWTIRPSLKHPTLELRAADSCTNLDDAIAIAGLYRTIVHYVATHPWVNWQMDAVARAIVVENKWRAQRYGRHGTFATADGAQTVGDRLEQIITEMGASATAVGTGTQLEHCRTILRDGTSADRQIAIYDDELGKGSDHTEALGAVTQWLAATTLDFRHA